MVVREELLILAMSRNSVLEEFRVRRFADLSYASISDHSGLFVFMKELTAYYNTI